LSVPDAVPPGPVTCTVTEYGWFDDVPLAGMLITPPKLPPLQFEDVVETMVAVLVSVQVLPWAIVAEIVNCPPDDVTVVGDDVMLTTCGAAEAVPG